MKNFDSNAKVLSAILNNIPDIAWLKDREGCILMVNEAYAASCGKKIEDIIGKKDRDIWHLELADLYRRDDEVVMATQKMMKVIEPLLDSSQRIIWIETIKSPVFDENGEVIGTTGTARDVTERKQIEEEKSNLILDLKKANEEIEKSRAELYESNVTLKHVLAHIEQEKVALKENVQMNIEKNVLPLLSKLKQNSRIDLSTVRLLEQELTQLTSAFQRRIMNYKFSLTPTEIKVCQFVKNDYSAKEIAAIMGIAISTVEEHKKNIRKKLGIKKRSMNLKTYLHEIPE